MNTWARCLGAAVLVAAVATGCGGSDSATPAPGGSSGAPGSAERGGQASNTATSVRVVVTGGIAGDHQVYEVTRDDTVSKSAERVLDLAAAPAVRDYATQQRRPSVQCCDIQVYEVTIRYADGTGTKITTDSTSAPTQLQRLVSVASTL
jgi:hypothetical protein